LILVNTTGVTEELFNPDFAMWENLGNLLSILFCVCINDWRRKIIGWY